MASGWITIANAVAETYGVDVHAKDRIGSIDEDKLNDREIVAKEFNNGQEAVQFGGQGVGGNAVAKFGTDDGASRDAAEAFASILNGLKTTGLLEEVLSADEFNFAALAEGAGAVFERETISSIADGVDFDFLVKPTSEDGNNPGQFLIQAGGQGVGGNAAVRFESEEQAQAFADLLNALEDAGLQDNLFL